MDEITHMPHGALHDMQCIMFHSLPCYASNHLSQNEETNSIQNTTTLDLS